MRIGIDCRMLGPEQGGLGRYVEQLVYHLSLSDQANEYVLFLRAANFDSVKIGNSHFKYKKVLADIPWYGWREQIQLPTILKTEKLDVMHFPHWNMPILYQGPWVVTIHDLIMYRYPRAEATTLGPVYYWFKEKISRIIIKRAVEKAARIVVTSEYTKQDVLTNFEVGAEKITVTYQAASLPCVEQKVSVPITKPYLLYVGAAYPHKNLNRLIEAWAKVQAKTNYAYELVLIGKDNFFYKKLRHLVGVVGIGGITFVDFVPDNELDRWYQNARLFVYPSLYEGFGLPPLEALAREIPVVAARASCLPEVLGAGALFFEPESVDDLSQVLIVGLTDEGMRKKVLELAHIQTAKYDWQNCAQKTLATYRSVL